MGEYITIAEYAKIKGISRQAVYKQVNQVDSRLSKYVRVVDNKKVLDSSVLSDALSTDVSTCQPEVTTKVSTGTDDGLQPAEASTPTAPDVVQALLDQLKTKDEQIANLTAQNEALQAQIIELTSSITKTADALASVTGALQAEQALHAGTIKNVGQLTEQATPSAPEEPEQAANQTETETVPLHWWQRLKRRK